MINIFQLIVDIFVIGFIIIFKFIFLSGKKTKLKEN